MALPFTRTRYYGKEPPIERCREHRASATRKNPKKLSKNSQHDYVREPIEEEMRKMRLLGCPLASAVSVAGKKVRATKTPRGKEIN